MAKYNIVNSNNEWKNMTQITTRMGKYSISTSNNERPNIENSDKD
jgi:hypothetical protein